MNKQEAAFDASKVQIGLRIRDLPESCTDELLFTQVFQKLKIDTKKVKAYKVKGHKTFFNCLGNAIVYFDSEEAAQDAMSKIIGFELHDKTISCSLMMPTQDLKLKNGKNIYVKNLKSTVTQKQFYEAASIHGQVLSILLQQNELGKLNGFATYKSVTGAEKAQQEGLKIEETQYPAKILTNQDNKERKSVMPTQTRNIELHFDTPLVSKGMSDADFENQLRNQIVQKFNLLPTSVFIWGTRARHFGKQSEETRVQSYNQDSTKSLKQQFNLAGDVQIMACGNLQQNGEYQCHLDEKLYDTNCLVLKHFQKKAFVCFDLKSEAQEFLNKFYGNYVSESASEDDKKLFDFTFQKEGVEVKVSTLRCVPEALKDKELEGKLNPKKNDKSFIYLKNLKKDITEEQIIKSIEENAQTKVISVKMSTPTPGQYIKDVQKTTETKFATIQLQDPAKSTEFITNFKQLQSVREKFNDIFENYKYANFLAPNKLHKKELKEKNEKSKRQSGNKQQMPPNAFPFYFPNFFNMLGKQMPIPVLKNAMPTMQPPFVQRLPMSFTPQFNNNNFRNQQNQNRNTNQQPPVQFNQQVNRPQNNNFQVNFNKNARANIVGQARGYNNNNNRPQQNFGVDQKKNFNQRGTANYNNQRQQPHDRNRNNLQKPSDLPEKKGVQAPPAKAPQAPIKPPKQQALYIPKIEDLKDKTDEQKKQILGKPLIEKITQLLPENQKILAPKVTALLLDFEIYEPEEVIAMLNSEEELKENINTSLELIQEATAQ
ncbi:hypothetical protein ABPG72_012545 [Tetrahymena utriculariae]